jgi:hypothetical protein
MLKSYPFSFTFLASKELSIMNLILYSNDTPLPNYVVGDPRRLCNLQVLERIKTEHLLKKTKHSARQGIVAVYLLAQHFC